MQKKNQSTEKKYQIIVVRTDSDDDTSYLVLEADNKEAAWQEWFRQLKAKPSESIIYRYATS